VAGCDERERETQQLATAEILLAQLDEHPTGRQLGERTDRVRGKIRLEPAVRDQVDNGNAHP
jgi:hypothetical protein